nr:winged helix-turn-helix domain-containing protein [Kitasatospora sp. MAA19]
MGRRESGCFPTASNLPAHPRSRPPPRGGTGSPLRGNRSSSARLTKWRVTARRGVSRPRRGRPPPAPGRSRRAARPAPGAAGTGRHRVPRRADVLRALDVPAMTTQLVDQLGLSRGTVGSRLAVLRDADLVTRTRVSRSVRYEHTPPGAALADS